MNFTKLSRQRAILGLAILAGTFAAGDTPGATISVTRGPYLQQGATNRMIVRWRTDVATASAVRHGTSPGSFTATNNDAASVTDHVVTITGLSADTKYYYEVGTSTAWFSGDANDYFVTSPPVGAAKPTRIWVLGDSGTASANAAAVRNAFYAYSAARPADLLLMLGDNAYNSGTDTEYQNAVFNFYPTVLQNTVLWSTIGNHDTAQSTTPLPTIPYFNMFSFPQNAEAGGVASGTEKYYSFDYANIHFVCLDAMSSDRGVSGPMCTWLGADLAATTQDWLVAFWHHPPYTKGSHDSDAESELIQMRQNVLPILESYGIDLILCGHSHSYERSYFLNGHYGNASTLTQTMKVDGGDGRTNGTGAYQKPAGTAANQGAVYAVCGSSGQISGGPLNHSAMFLSLNQLGSLVIDVTSNRLDLTFLKTNATAGDYFTILKTPAATTPPVGPTALAATAVSSSQINLSWTDHAIDELGFKVERSINGINFVQFATVGANVIDGADTGLAPATTYDYRVRAYNTAGDSPYSNVAQATTAAGPVTSVLIASNSVWKYLDNGTDQGTAWRNPSFDDAAWVSGPAELGYGDGGEGTVVSYGPNASAKFITTYFRRTFTVVNPAAYTNLFIQLVRDDGAVIYLNGVEIHRANLPAGTVASTTLAVTAMGGTDESTYFSTNVSPANLVSGVNLLAIEVHQSAANSSDLSFNLQLTASGPAASGDTTAPAAVGNLTVSAVTASSVTLLWTAPGDDGSSGTASSYDVRYGIAPITEANWPAATSAIGEPAPAPAGNSQAFTITGLAPGVTYHFALKTSDEASNVSPLSNVPTATTTLNPPAAPSGLTATAVSSGEIDLEWIDNSDDETSFTIDRSINGVDFVLLGTVGANVTSAADLSVAPLSTYYYRVRAGNAAGDSANSSVAQATTPAAPVTTVLIASNAVWKFLDNGTDQGAGWSAPAFDDTAWAGGPAELGYGDGGEATVIGFGPDANNKYITTYFRKSFTVANAATITNLLLELVRDDGAVVYLNGVEVYRSNLPAGAVTFSTLAITAIGGADESAWSAASLPTTALVSGNNVLAAEIHQANATSSDVSFNLQLTATGAATTPPPPAAPSGLTATAISPTRIDLAWVGNSSDEDGFRVERKTGPEGAYAEIAVTSPDATAFSDADLTPDTTYFYQVRAYNSAGSSPYSNEASATTFPPPDTTPPAAVADLASAGVTTNSITLSWTAPGDDGLSGTAAAYDLRLSTSPITEANWNAATPVIGLLAPAPAGTLETVNVNGLNAGTTYYFGLKSADESGNVSPLSNVPSGSTATPPDTTAPAAVASLAVTTVTTSSATLTGNAPGDDGNLGTAASYDLRCNTAPITEANWASALTVTGEPAPAAAGTLQTLTVTGLSAGTTYYFALKTSDEASNLSPISNVPSATTAGVPNPWLTQDIGAVAAAGSANHTNGAFTVRGSGADIWGALDEFRFVHQAASGNCEIRARVTAAQNTDPWAKVGVMIRESVNANSKHAMMVLTPGNGLAFQRRAATGGSSATTSGGAATAPYWVRMVRTGNSFTAYKSANGTAWTQVGSAVTISMGASVRIGLVVTSHKDGTLNTSTFDNVTATP